MILRMLLSRAKHFAKKLCFDGPQGHAEVRVIQLYSHYCPPNDVTYASNHYEKIPNFKNSIIKNIQTFVYSNRTQRFIWP